MIQVNNLDTNKIIIRNGILSCDDIYEISKL